MSATIDPTATPALIATETSPSDVTLFLDIDLHISHSSSQSPAKAMTAVYVPDRTKLRPPFDVIFYFHGWKKTSGITIQDYLKDPQFDLRGSILKSKKRDVILVAPTLGDKAAYGLMGNADQANNYLEQVTNGIHKHLFGGTGDRKTIGRLILAAHSGGGEAIRALSGFASVDKSIEEVWCIDSTYGGGSHWLRWAKKAGHTMDRLWIFSTGSWTAEILLDPKKKKGPDNPVVDTKREGTGDQARIVLDGARKGGLSNVEVLIKPVPPDTNRTKNFTYGVASGHNESVGFYFTQLVDSSVTLL